MNLRKKNKEKLRGHNTIQATCMDGGMVLPQICAAGGGGGGRPPEAPGNQDVEANGSADRIVISGRLATDQIAGSSPQETHVFTHITAEKKRQTTRTHETKKVQKAQADTRIEPLTLLQLHSYLRSRSLSRSLSLEVSDRDVGLVDAERNTANKKAKGN